MGLRPHGLKIVLVEPEIPQNTGNVARLCVVTGAELHLVRPLGFFLSEKHLKRAGMDYLDQVKMVVHDDLAALRVAMGSDRYWLATARGDKGMWEVGFAAGDWIVLGRETAGLPKDWTDAERGRTVGIPMIEGQRCLNLSTAAGILLYEAIRQVELSGRQVPRSS